MMNEGHLVTTIYHKENSIPRKHPPSLECKHFVLLTSIFCFIWFRTIEFRDLSVASGPAPTGQL